MIDTKTPKRLVSLDVFRGITVALMILVNSSGNQTPYAWLDHSAWNGCTLADLVFPFFIFIVGVSSAFTLTNARERHASFCPLLIKIVKRALILFLVGLALNAFPHHFDFSTLRFYGVLQRIAVCYLVVSLLFLTTRFFTQAIILLVIMVGYYLLMTHPPISGYEGPLLTPSGNFAAYVDRWIFSSHHLYGKTFDPEGFLSTFPAIATALMGCLTASWLMLTGSPVKKITGMVTAGILSMMAGMLWGQFFPINKALWTSSYVLWTGGLALLLLALCYWLIEVKAWVKWSKPFEFFGKHAMLAFVLHVMFLKIQAIISMPMIDGSLGNLRLYLTQHLFGWASLQNASLLYALSYTLLWLFLIKLYTLFKKV